MIDKKCVCPLFVFYFLFCRMTISSRQCGWCYEDINSAGLVTLVGALPCGHIFCGQCSRHGVAKPCPTCSTQNRVVQQLEPTPATPTLVAIPWAASVPILEHMARLGVTGAENLVLPPETLVLGSVLSTAGNECVVHRGTLRGMQVSEEHIQQMVCGNWVQHSISVVVNTC